jgi:BirA family biotin operon repressor/biotin-[acetyl-CoA-carboxylase] ligase
MSKERLNTEEILLRLEKGAGCSLFWRNEVDSTNEWAKRAAKEGAEGGSVFLAESQTAGKGRRGHSWASLPGASVSMSILLRPELPPDRVSMITLVMGMAAAAGFRKVCGLEAGIKWPNDVVASGKKLCGILTEMHPAGGFVVIGVGMNLNNRDFPPELADRATSLYLETGRTVSREETAAAVLNGFREYYGRFLQSGDLSLLQEEYNHMLVNRGRQVRIMDQADPFEGTALGIDCLGRLLVERADTGKTEQVYAGEVSVRGIFGYV